MPLLRPWRRARGQLPLLPSCVSVPSRYNIYFAVPLLFFLYEKVGHHQIFDCFPLIFRQNHTFGRDVPTEGTWGDIAPPNIFKFARKLVKRQPCCKRDGNSIFCDLFLLVIVGQLVKTPPNRKCLGTSLTFGA